jgi:glutamine amidotransferase
MNQCQPTVTIVHTGTANMASVTAGFLRLGAIVHMTDDPHVVRDADVLVLPGVGSFGATMQRLHADDLVEPLRQRILENRSTLAICLGMQLLCVESEESAGVAGLGAVDARLERFDDALRVPHLGWNEVLPQDGVSLMRPGCAYFANSYRLVDPPTGWAVAATNYGGQFISALQRGRVLACQFHPELSGTWGRDLLDRWLTSTRDGQGDGPC